MPAPVADVKLIWEVPALKVRAVALALIAAVPEALQVKVDAPS